MLNILRIEPFRQVFNEILTLRVFNVINDKREFILQRNALHNIAHEDLLEVKQTTQFLDRQIIGELKQVDCFLRGVARLEDHHNVLALINHLIFNVIVREFFVKVVAEFLV